MLDQLSDYAGTMWMVWGASGTRARCWEWKQLIFVLICGSILTNCSALATSNAYILHTDKVNGPCQLEIGVAVDTLDGFEVNKIAHSLQKTCDYVWAESGNADLLFLAPQYFRAACRIEDPCAGIIAKRNQILPKERVCYDMVIANISFQHDRLRLSRLSPFTIYCNKNYKGLLTSTYMNQKRFETDTRREVGEAVEGILDIHKVTTSKAEEIVAKLTDILKAVAEPFQPNRSDCSGMIDESKLLLELKTLLGDELNKAVAKLGTAHTEDQQHEMLSSAGIVALMTLTLSGTTLLLMIAVSCVAFVKTSSTAVRSGADNQPPSKQT